MAIPLRQIRRGPYDPQIDDLIRFYRAALLEIKDRAITRLVRDRRVLTAEALRARQVAGEVEEILAELQAIRDGWLAREIPLAYKNGTSRATIGLREIGIRAIPSVNPVVHQQAVEVLIGAFQDRFAEMDAELLRGLRRVIRSTQTDAATDRFIRTQTAKGIAIGKARREVSAEIRDQLIQQWGEAPFRVGGRSFTADGYAEMVARTMTAEAQSAGTVNRVLEAGQDLVVVTAHGATDACGYYEGKVFSLTGRSEKYPPVSSLPNGGPPFHPNCRHGLAPFVEDYASQAERRRATGVPQKALGKPFNEVEKARRAAA